MLKEVDLGGFTDFLLDKRCSYEYLAIYDIDDDALVLEEGLERALR